MADGPDAKKARAPFGAQAFLLLCCQIGFLSSSSRRSLSLAPMGCERTAEKWRSVPGFRFAVGNKNRASTHLG